MTAKIKLGPAGTDGDSIAGIKHVAELGLQACEIEFVHGVNMGDEKAILIGKLAKELKVDLSIHAPYFINLVSEDITKIEASKQRILDTCRKGHLMGAKHIVFHAAFYGTLSEEEVFQKVKKEVIEMLAEIKKNKWEVILSPETTGKTSQFGTLDELLRLAAETGCALTIDFAHIYARNNGKIDYDEIFSKLKKSKIAHFHCHFSGIEYTVKGEKKHLVMTEEVIKPLLSSAVKHGMDLTVISESPITWQDSLKMRAILEKLV